MEYNLKCRETFIFIGFITFEDQRAREVYISDSLADAETAYELIKARLDSSPENNNKTTATATAKLPNMKVLITPHPNINHN